MSSTGTLFVGTGEANPGCGSLTYPGNGVYRSTDGGRTWQNVGLGHSARIGMLAVDPANPRVVFAAATGSLFNPGGQRGLYRSTNNGSSWHLVLPAPNPTTGADNILIDPRHPRVVYATMWDHYETPRLCHYGGVGTGVYKSTNGGTAWRRLGGGLPAPSPRLGGRIGLALAPSQPNRLYALLDDVGGLFEAFLTSTDAGRTWVKRRSDRRLAESQSSFGWWFGRLWVDPRNPRHVFAPGVPLMQSHDAGRSWRAEFQTHVDQHAMAWDPRVPGRVYLGNDGGFYRNESNGRPSDWVKSTYMPWTQFYSVTSSRQQPSRIVGGTQDNGVVRTWGGPRWNEQFDADGTAVLINPRQQRFVFVCGELGFCARSTNGGTSLTTIPRPPYRFGWFAPMEFNPTNPRVLYWGANRLLRSTDSGRTWHVISPDLTGGPGPSGPGFQNTTGTISAIAVAVSDPRVIYVGTDDGRVWVTGNGGGTWHRLLRGQLWVTGLAVDPRNSRAAYVTTSGFNRGVGRAVVLRTANRGRSWVNIAGDLPRSPVNDIIFGPGHALYVAQNAGVAMSRTAGKHWVRIGTSLPNVPVYMLDYNPSARRLLAATFGRGVYAFPTPR
jgi:photosystem II stability/assembly factor-like uncharacterized protein